jgi:hypothetical protein
MKRFAVLLLALSAAVFAADPQEARILQLMEKVMDRRPGELTLDAKESGTGFVVYLAKRAGADGKTTDQRYLIFQPTQKRILVGDYFNLGRFKDRTIDPALVADFLSSAMGSAVKVVQGEPKTDAAALSVLQETGYGKVTLSAWLLGRVHFIMGKAYALDADPVAERIQGIQWQRGGVIGPADAPNTLAVFLDLECPHCAKIEQELLPLLKARPDIRAGFFQFPLTQGHPLAFKAAAASLCYLERGNGLYFEFMDYFYPLRKDVEFSTVDLTNYGFAQMKGLEEPFLACYMKEGNVNAVLAAMQMAVDLGVIHTPTLFYNGVSYFPLDLLNLLKPPAAAPAEPEAPGR